MFWECMAETQMRMPGGIGGLMRYDAEYKSRFMVSPAAVVGFVVFVLLFVIVLKILFPVGA